MDRKSFLLLAGGSLLVVACEKREEKPRPPAPNGPVTMYLSADLTLEMLTIGSFKQDADKLVFVQRVAAGNSPGAFQHFSLSCPHAGCLTVRQAATGDFHCPCHGSQFSPNGTLLAGPAVRPLGQHVLSITGNTLFIRSA